MKIINLINDTYQIIDQDENVLFQGTYDGCLRYIMDYMLNKINSTPELLNVFKRLKDR
jgi:hypothetical protein